MPRRPLLLLAGLILPLFSVSTPAQTAHFTSAQMGIGSGYYDPAGIAVDAAGNVFVADTNNNVVKEVTAASRYTTINTLGSGFNRPQGVAVDQGGNVFVADTGNNAVKEILTAGGYSTVLTLGSGFRSPTSVALDVNGNVFVADQQNSAIKEILAAGGYTTVNSIGLNAAFNFPRGVAVDKSGNVFVADTDNDVIEELMPGDGYSHALIIASHLYFPLAVTVDGSGNVFFSATSGPAVVELMAAGGFSTSKVVGGSYVSPFGIAVDGNGDIFVANASGNYPIQKVTLSNGVFGAQNVGSNSFPNLVSLVFTFDTGGILGSTAVVTQGATGLDFINAGGGSCVAGHSYNAGDSCYINVEFAPIAPGARYGAGELIDGSGNLLATGYLQGTGTGPQIAFAPPVQNMQVGGFSFPIGMAVDGSGNVYVAEGGNVVAKIPSGCTSSSCVTSLGGGFNSPGGVAVDGSGNVYIADFGNSAVKEMPAGCSSSSCVTTLGGGFSSPQGLAVDGAANVYVADSGDSAVKEMPSGCSSSSCVITLGGGFDWPFGVAVDGDGNVYVADTDNNAVKEMPSGCGSLSCVKTLGGGFGNPDGVTVGAAGNVYVADTDGNAVKEMPSNCSSSSCVMTLAVGLSYPTGVTVDRNSNLYFAQTGNNSVTELSFGTPPAEVTFPTTTNVGVLDSTDGPMAFTVENIGNAPLIFSVPSAGFNPSIAAGFGYDASSSCPQLSTSSSAYNLVPGASCTYAVDFIPVTSGVNSGSLLLSDNSLNNNSSWQTISLNGTGTSAAATPQAISFAPLPSEVLYGTAPIMLSATGGGSGNPVMFTVLSGPGSITDGSILMFTGTGAVVVAADQLGNAVYSAAPEVTQMVTVLPTSYTAPTEPVATSSATQTGTLLFSSGFTLGSIQVVTQGATGLDFNIASGGTCAVGTAYTTGQTCTVNYTFTPTAPGVRYGAIEIFDNGSNLQATLYLNGNGTAPLAALTPGIISTIAGSGGYGYSGDSGPALNATFSFPSGIAVAPNGNVYIGDIYSNAVRKIDISSGNIVLVAGTGSGGDGGPATGATLNNPYGVALDPGGNLYIADSGDAEIRRVDAVTGIITTVAGNGTQGYAGDGGPATAASLNTPYGITADGNGNLYFADSGNSSIRRVDALTHQISTVAGNGTAGFSGDGGLATAASLNGPEGVAVDPAGNLYIPDFNNNRIRKVDATTGVITTIIGNGNAAYTGDGGPANAATVWAPTEVSLDGNGNLYIADYGNSAVRRVDISTGYIYTVAGNGNRGYNGDGQAATSANLFLSTGAATDSAGNLYIADQHDNRIRKVNVSTATMSFGSASVGQASGAQSVTLSNLGNATIAAVAPGLTAPVDFTQAAGSGTPPDCTSSFSLGVGARCNLSIELAPKTAGALTESFVLTDNSLNVGGATQVIGLTGTGTASAASVTVGTSPMGLSFSINGTPYNTTQTPSMTIGTQYTLATSSPQIGGPGVQYVFSQWSDGTTSLIDTLTPTASTSSDTADFTTQYLLTVTAGSGGIIGVSTSPNGFYNAGTAQALAAIANAGYYFTGWTGANSPSDIASTTSANTTVTLNGPENLSANFAPIPGYQVTTLNDDATGNAGNCTTPSPNCTLRDALAAAAAAGAGNITFSSSMFSSPTTIQLNGGLTIPANTTITGVTTGSGATLTNLVTVSGGGSTNPSFSVFAVNPGITGAAINNLDIINGSAGTGYGGGISNIRGALIVSHCTLSGNSAYGAGAILNQFGTLTVNNSAISGNSADDFGAGVVNDSGTMTLSSTTVSGNSAVTQGGGIYNSGTLTITASTIADNSSGLTSYGVGGGINNSSGTLTVISSTVSGNSASGYGGGIYNGAALTVSNSIFAGNNSSGGYVDIYPDEPYTDNGGNQIGDGPGPSMITINLAPLGNYGGPTQTMPPLPGSPAICAGLASNIPSGVTADQRGYPNTNTTYSGYSSISPCVDSGAVQTNYALNFATNPPPTGTVSGAGMSPAPTVTVMESGNALAGSSTSVSVTDANSDLTTSPATAITSTSNGQATFNTLIFTGATSNDLLTASLALNQNIGLNLTATSTRFSVLATNVPPAITSAASATFTTGLAGTFTVTATGYPAPTFARTGTLPGGVTFAAATGVLSGTPGVNAGGSYSLTFTATNSVGTSAAQSFTLTVNQLPKITSAVKTTFTVGTAGTFTMTASGYPAPTFSQTGALPSGVTLSAAGVLSGTPAADTGGVYSISVTASNAAGSSTTQAFTLTVDQAPAITSAAAATFTTGTAGTFTVMATGYPAPTFARTGTLPGGVTFAAATGVLSGTPGVNAGGSYSLTFTATNSVGTSAAQSFTLTVNQLPKITSAVKTTFTVGTAGTFTMTASGYPAPTFSQTGALPSGVTLSAAGVLSGTPAADTGGVYSISVTASNAAGSSTTQAFTLTVDQAPAITSAAAATFTTGTAGTFTVMATGYPAPTFARTGTLPGGVTFAAATGVLSGTPGVNAGGSYSLTFTATNSVGTSAAQSFTLTVNQLPKITSAVKTTFTVGTAGTFTMTASGYPAPTFSQTGALPSGVTLSAAGVLSGTPAADTGGVYSISVTASNAAGSSTTQAFTLTVDQAPAITSAAAATFTTGTAGTFTVMATGYPAPTFARTGTLPGGVTFAAATGVLSGTPKAGTAGTYTLHFASSNGVGTNATQTFVLTVN